MTQASPGTATPFPDGFDQTLGDQDRGGLEHLTGAGDHLDVGNGIERRRNRRLGPGGTRRTDQQQNRPKRTDRSHTYPPRLFQGSQLYSIRPPWRLGCLASTARSCSNPSAHN